MTWKVGVDSCSWLRGTDCHPLFLTTNHLVLLGEISCYKDEIETELEKSRPRLRGIYAAYTKEPGPLCSLSG